MRGFPGLESSVGGNVGIRKVGNPSFGGGSPVSPLTGIQNVSRGVKGWHPDCEGQIISDFGPVLRVRGELVRSQYRIDKPCAREDSSTRVTTSSAARTLVPCGEAKVELRDKAKGPIPSSCDPASCD